VQIKNTTTDVRAIPALLFPHPPLYFLYSPTFPLILLQTRAIGGLKIVHHETGGEEIAFRFHRKSRILGGACVRVSYLSTCAAGVMWIICTGMGC
jgi:hypothetical protein